MRELNECVNIVLAGEAGQGIQSIEALLSRILKQEGYHLFSTKEYMSRIRGGVNSTQIRVSSRRVAAYSTKSDVAVLLNQESVAHLQARISPDTVILGEKSVVSHPALVDVPFSGIAAGIGNKLFANTVAVGVICGLFKADPARCEAVIARQYARKDAAVQQGNSEALRQGYALAAGLFKDRLLLNIKKDAAGQGELIYSGSEAIALGALAAGCDYVCAYPMSPGTGVLNAMASYSKAFDIIVEQVEDEIGVVNMALGAWYAGARALVTTSGGGFALMSEGFSLAGMIESPLVIHLAQRPGPATGLPTRTEQADLNLVLYAGHGEFPRVILAPGTLEQGFHLTQRAFALADKYQVPVVILSDQYFVDSYYDTPLPDLGAAAGERHIVETAPGYRRYDLQPARSAPGAFPDTATASSRWTATSTTRQATSPRTWALRVRMVRQAAAETGTAARGRRRRPVLSGDPGAETMVVSWGSTSPGVEEALAGSAAAAISAISIFPRCTRCRPRLDRLLNKARKRIVIEGNATRAVRQAAANGRPGSPIERENPEVRRHALRGGRDSSAALAAGR